MNLGSKVVTFENRDGELFVGVGDRFASQGPKGLLVVQTVRAIADHMCRRRLASWDVRLEWYETSSDTDLPPAGIKDGVAFGFDHESARVVHEAETRWFAKRHAQTPKEWIATATLLQAMDIVAKDAGRPTLATADWHSDTKAQDVGKHDDLISHACRIKGWTLDELRREATERRNVISHGDIWDRERLRRRTART
jgi:hypothetical protein